MSERRHEAFRRPSEGSTSNFAGREEAERGPGFSGEARGAGKKRERQSVCREAKEN